MNIGSVTPSHVPTREEVKGITRLGAGGFGTAYAVTSENAKKSVIKIINQSYDLPNYGYSPQEIMLACSYTHPNLAHGIGVERAEKIHPEFKGRGLAVALTQYEHSLSNFLNRFTMKHRISIALDIIHGYKALRELGWVHLDIKPDNILIRDRSSRNGNMVTAVIADFGTCRPIAKANDFRYGISAGTPNFIPPECFESPGKILTVLRYEEKFDIYSLGKTLALIFVGFEYPTKEFESQAIDAVQNMIAKRSDRWLLSDLLNSDFYISLCKLSVPGHNYVSPTLRFPADEKKLDTTVSRILAAEITDLTRRARNARDAYGVVFGFISIEVIARTQNILAVLRNDLINRGGRYLVQAALRLAYKMICTGELNVELFFGKDVDKREILRYEEEILLSSYNKLYANSVFDTSDSLQQYASLLVEMTPKQPHISGCIYSTNAGDKNQSISAIKL